MSKPRAHLLLRPAPAYRRDSFAAGLEAAGYQIDGTPRADPAPGDILVIWNRYGREHLLAQRFERAGNVVLVAENGPLGRTWLETQWYALTRTLPLARGEFVAGPVDRWDSFGVDICEWRKNGTEIIVLAQRGIGPPGVAQPRDWHQLAAQSLKRHAPVRIREHPGEKPALDLATDLRRALCVVTWASGAALKALLWGLPVFYGLPGWIASSAAELFDPRAPLELFDRLPLAYGRARLPFFRALGWTMWRTHELATGTPFLRLLGGD